MSATVLVADDDEDLRDVVSWCLRAEGYRVVTACDGREALRSLSEHAVDLLVLDLQMPVLDGLGVLCRMKGDERMRGVPVLVLTARPEEAPPEAILVSKPFDPARLIDFVNALAGQVGTAMIGR